MVNRQIAQRPQESPLSLAEIQNYLSPNATKAEGYTFLRFCQAQGLNPFIGEAYLIKYAKDSKAAIVIGIAALLKRASRNPNYDGYQSGIILEDEGATVEVHGTIRLAGQTLLGGWAQVRRKDWSEPLKVTVSLQEYDKGQSLWKSMPATMIEKTALAQGLRRGFPEETESLFAGEIQVEVGDANVAKMEDVLEAGSRPEQSLPEKADDAEKPDTVDTAGLFPEAPQPQQQGPGRPSVKETTSPDRQSPPDADVEAPVGIPKPTPPVQFTNNAAGLRKLEAFWNARTGAGAEDILKELNVGSGTAITTGMGVQAAHEKLLDKWGKAQ